MKKLITALGVALSLGLSASAMAKDSVKVGFVYVSPIGEAGWTYTHDVSRRYLEDKFGEKIKTTFVESVPVGVIIPTKLASTCCRAAKKDSVSPGLSSTA